MIFLMPHSFSRHHVNRQGRATGRTRLPLPEHTERPPDASSVRIWPHDEQSVPPSKESAKRAQGPANALTHLRTLEAESIHIVREVVAELGLCCGMTIASRILPWPV
jgi:hypothetical protein